MTAKGDLDGDGKSDLPWRHQDGILYAWLMNGGAVKAQSALPSLQARQSIIALAYLDGDGKAVLVIRGVGGALEARLVDGLTIVNSAVLGGRLGWSLARSVDLDGDIKSDLLWRNDATVQLYAWPMDGTSVTVAGSYATP